VATFTKSAATGGFRTSQPESARTSTRLLRFQWRGIVTLVERVTICGDRLVIRLNAGQRTKASPTRFDQVHAGVCALIVLQQPEYRCFRKRCHASLSYTDGTTEAVSVDLDNLFLTLSRLAAAPGHRTNLDDWLVSPLVAYLLLSDEDGRRRNFEEISKLS
jgi:hypothetical protein